MQGLSQSDDRDVSWHSCSRLREWTEAQKPEVLCGNDRTYLSRRPVMDDDPLFRSGHEACRFAYSYSGQQYPMTIMAKMMRGRLLGSGRGLVGLEGAAVAGTVKRHVEALRFPSPEIISARYELMRDKALPHADSLVEFVIPALGTGGHRRRLVRALICRYFRIPDENGRPIMLARLASDFDLSTDTLTRRWVAVRNRLREVEARAESEIDGTLVDAGLVQSR